MNILNSSQQYDTNNELNKTQAEKFIKIAQNSTSGSNLTTEQKSKIAEAARGFESIFLNFFMKEIKGGLLGTGESESANESANGLTFGMGTLQGYNQLLLSDYLSKKGNGIGIANLIYKNLTGDYLTNNSNIQDPIKESNEILQNNNLNSDTTNIQGQNQLNSSTNNAISLEQNNSNTNYKGNFIDKMEDRLNKYEDIINSASGNYDIPKELIKAVISAESAGNQSAVSSTGAKGLMQLMDGTAKELGVSNSFNPLENIQGGVRYLKSMLDKYQGDYKLALAAYNAGPGNVDKYNGIPPFKETQNYVNRVMRYYKQFSQNSNASEV